MNRLAQENVSLTVLEPLVAVTKEHVTELGRAYVLKAPDGYLVTLQESNPDNSIKSTAFTLNLRGQVTSAEAKIIKSGQEDQPADVTVKLGDVIAAVRDVMK